MDVEIRIATLAWEEAVQLLNSAIKLEFESPADLSFRQDAIGG
jgi:hypothetical protein